VRERERSRAVVRDVSLDPLLRARDLRAHGRLVVLAEIRVPQRVIADLVALEDQVLQLPAGR
jgi:hypothetical protein